VLREEGKEPDPEYFRPRNFQLYYTFFLHQQELLQGKVKLKNPVALP